MVGKVEVHHGNAVDPVRIPAAASYFLDIRSLYPAPQDIGIDNWITRRMTESDQDYFGILTGLF